MLGLKCEVFGVLVYKANKAEQKQLLDMEAAHQPNGFFMSLTLGCLFGKVKAFWSHKVHFGHSYIMMLHLAGALVIWSLASGCFHKQLIISLTGSKGSFKYFSA